MSFNIDRFGSDASNVKSIFGGVCYYRYFNKDNNDVTVAGYFPASLGLQLGDRIKVIPATKTDADEEYIVSDITNRIVTVIKVETGGSVDTSKVVNADVLPTASADNVGYVYLYTGTTDASYTHGYIYECKKSATYTGTVSFEAATLSGTTIACSGSDFATFVAEWGSGDITTITNGTLTYDESGELLVFVGQDDTDTTVCTFQLYVQDYVDAGFTFTGTFQDGDVIAFTCTIEETGATYAWVRQDVQPQPAKELPTQAGNSGKYLKTNGVSASWAAVESLPDQTGQSGKFLTTDGSTASWGDALTNNATLPQFSIRVGSSTGSLNGTGQVYLGKDIAGNNGTNSTIIGCQAKDSSSQGTVIIGYGAESGILSNYGIAIGNNAKTGTSARSSIAIGRLTATSAQNAIQLGGAGGGSTTTYTNSDANTFKVGNANGNFEIMSADGTIPADRLTNAINKYSTMPTAAAGNLGWIVQFTGTTDSTYTHGHLYECVSDGADPATYSWTQVEVQPAGSSLPSQSGQSGKFLTTDGTDASWGTISALENTATGDQSLKILGNTISLPADFYVALGYYSAAWTSSVAIGYYAVSGDLGTIAIGASTEATQPFAIVIGDGSKATAVCAIQLGSTGSEDNYYTNSDANTFKVGNANGNFEMMSADGTIPADRLASTTGLADGNYRLRLTMANGVPTLTWVAE